MQRIRTHPVLPSMKLMKRKVCCYLSKHQLNSYRILSRRRCLNRLSRCKKGRADLSLALPKKPLRAGCRDPAGSRKRCRIRYRLQLSIRNGDNTWALFRIVLVVFQCLECKSFHRFECLICAFLDLFFDTIVPGKPPLHILIFVVSKTALKNTTIAI